MTENKRFFYMSGIIFDNTKDKREWGISINDLDKGLRIVDLLNELHEENKKLKQVNEMLQMDSVMTERNLVEENEQLKFENNELKCALALDNVDYIIADGKKIDIPPYYEFEQRYDSVMHRREYDGYD